jgi:phage/plasmid-associated DNA primase
MKRMLFGLGVTNSGKSILTKAVTLSCGDYVGSFNAENLAYRNSSNDEAQNNRWAMLLRFKRIIFSNEIKSSVELNGNAIKKIASGGDTMIGRNHCKAEEEFIMHCLSVVLANDLPKIKPYDDAVNTRVRVVSYKKEFVENPTNEFQLPKDNQIDEEIKTLRFQRAFVGILILAYMEQTDDEPAEVISAKQDWIGEDISVIETFKNDYEITGNPDDYVVSRDIEDWIKSKSLGITMKKFGMEMKKYLIIHKMEGVESKKKKVYGKAIHVWTGIKLIVEEPPII